MTRSKEIFSHTPSLVGMQLVMLYYAYLMLVRRIFDVYNCNETEPPDGYMYTDFTDLDCEGGMCICYEPYSGIDALFNDAHRVQQRLMFFSFPAMAMYMLGFPLYVLYIVRRFKILIKEDQLLRAHGVGDTEADNPFAYHIRIKFHRVYYHFKPGKSYWFVLIVFRKFWIAMVGILLKNNPGFQLAVCMLVLLYCYVLQQNHRPYM